MLANIQMLRGIAALLVFLHHAAPHYAAMGGQNPFIKSLGYFGFAGVDIFFVISGFVIAHTTLTKERTLQNAAEFIKHRFFRIYLGYWSFLVILAALKWIFTPDSLRTVSWLHSVFLTSIDMKELILPVSWTLSFELYFYSLFLLSFLLPAGMAKKVVYVIFLGILVKTFYFGPPKANTAADFLLSPFLLEFFGGAILYSVLQRFNHWTAMVLAAGIAIAAYSVAILLDARNGPMRIYTFGSGAVALVMLGLLLEKNGIYRAGLPFIAVGNASYTIYLSHLVFLLLFVGVRTLLSQLGSPFIEIGFVAYIAAATALSMLFYTRIEKPLYKWACSIRLFSSRHSELKPRASL